MLVLGSFAYANEQRHQVLHIQAQILLTEVIVVTRLLSITAVTIWF